MQLLYIADPLCSWCYGFEPELRRFLERHPEARLELVMGGLRAYNTAIMTAAFKDTLREHWRHVQEASALPFNDSLLARADFIYDTEPPCRGVVTARTLDPSKAHTYFGAVQAAFYRDAQDVTRAKTLIEIAGACGYETSAFAGSLESDALRLATRRDFETTQSLGVSGFPTLGAAYGTQLYLVTSGYVTDDVLEYRAAEIARLAGERALSRAG
ncbi:MAG TPA: DsbA family protein [Usitatibacter sp.]|nr:DsbA family protein [Usitatibacter sp.]